MNFKCIYANIYNSRGLISNIFYFISLCNSLVIFEQIYYPNMPKIKEIGVKNVKNITVGMYNRTKLMMNK